MGTVRRAVPFGLQPDEANPGELFMRALFQAVSIAGLLFVVAGRFEGGEAFTAPGVFLLGVACVGDAIVLQAKSADRWHVVRRLLSIMVGAWFMLAGFNVVPISGSYDVETGESNWNYFDPQR